MCFDLVGCRLSPRRPEECLVVELENLPDYAYQDIVSIVESEPAQRNGNLYEVFSRTRLSDGNIVLSWLHQTGRLRKYDTTNVDLIPSNSSKLNLATLNRIIQLQTDGKTEKEIEQILADDTDSPPRTFNNSVNDTTPSNTDGILTDEDLAKSYLEQSKTMLAESERLKKEAFKLDPSLKKTRKTTSKEKIAEPINEETS